MKSTTKKKNNVNVYKNKNVTKKNKKFIKKKKLYGGGGGMSRQKKYELNTQDIDINSTSISTLLSNMSLSKQNKIETQLYNIPKTEELKEEITTKTIKGIVCTYISRGTYARVWEIIHKDVKLAIKIPLPGPPLDEITILENIEQNIYSNIYDCDHIIPIIKFGKKSIIMIRADNNLLKLIKDQPDFNKNNKNNSNIIKTIYNALECLSKKGLYYYDIKFENILYRKINGNIEIFLGDIGSIQTLKEIKKFLMATFQTPYLRKANKKRKKDKNKFFIEFVQEEIDKKKLMKICLKK